MYSQSKCILAKVSIYDYKCLVIFKWLYYNCVSFLDLLNIYSGARPFSCFIAIKMELCVQVFLDCHILFLVDNELAVLFIMYVFLQV